MKRRILGPRAVEEALRASPGNLAVVYTTGEGPSSLALAEAARQRGVQIELRTPAELDAIARGARHQGVVAIGGDYPYQSLDEVLHQAQAAPLLVALDQIVDPQNLGAICRNAAAFGADGVLIPERRAAPVTPAAVRASAGATEHLRIARITNLATTLQRLRSDGMQVVGLDVDGDTDLRTLDYPAAGRVLVVGSEGQGLRRLVRERCELLARFELTGPIRSLNAAAATAIALYESARRRASPALPSRQ